MDYAVWCSLYFFYYAVVLTDVRKSSKPGKEKTCSTSVFTSANLLLVLLMLNRNHQVEAIYV